MRLDDVYVISDKLDVAVGDQIRLAEIALGTRFPKGYRDYVTTLGAGTLNGQIRALPPTEIVEKTAEYRDIEAEVMAGADENGFSRWDLVMAGLDLLPPERWLSAVLLIDPGDGHRIVFHPDAPDELFFIDHDDQEVHRAGSTLDEALAWFLETGPWGARTRVLMPDGHFVERPVRYFEPDRDREQISFDLKETVASTEVRAHLLDLALHDPDGTLFVSEAYTNDEDGTEGEVLHLFVKEYGGAIWCNDLPPEQGGITIQITYDRERQTAHLDQLTDFCCSRATRFMGPDNRVFLL
jgi:hypothetical protein